MKNNRLLNLFEAILTCFYPVKIKFGLFKSFRKSLKKQKQETGFQGNMGLVKTNLNMFHN